MKSKKKTLVIVDAGHGVDTAGKQSPNTVLREYAWNRDCAKILIETLNALPGFEAYNLVPEESEIDVPLSTRVKRANNVYKAYRENYNIVLVSIHCNAHKNEWTKARGWSIYTTKGTTESDSIATSIWNAAKSKFVAQKIRADRSDGDPDYEENFYILRNTNCPAVLIENFFMTSKEDYEYLISPTSIYDCAEVIVNGLKSYYNVAI